MCQQSPRSAEKIDTTQNAIHLALLFFLVWTTTSKCSYVDDRIIHFLRTQIDRKVSGTANHVNRWKWQVRKQVSVRNSHQIQKYISNLRANLCFMASDESCQNHFSRCSRTWSANRARALTNLWSSRTRAISKARFSTELPFSKILSNRVNKINSLRGWWISGHSKKLCHSESKNQPDWEEHENRILACTMKQRRTKR